MRLATSTKGLIISTKPFAGSPVGVQMRSFWSTLFAILLTATQAVGQVAPGAAPAPDKPDVAAPADQELIYQGEATSILGRAVRGPSGEMVGRIVDVLVGDAGVPRAAVIEFGGFMGVGNRRVAVAWRALRFAPGAAGQPASSAAIAVDMTEDQIRSIPEFRRSPKPADPPVTVAVPPRPNLPAPAPDPAPTPAPVPAPTPTPTPAPQP
jgi:hypothetical protein